MNFKRWDNITGWAVFAVAAVTYLLTMEPTASFWDCSEFIATSYKLEVGHPPGAPLFMMLARLATLLAPSTEYVPVMVNAMNGIFSALCILFMFWTITHLGRRLCIRNRGELSTADGIAVLGAGAVGALAYTFTDTFWFSAYEGEVYALSSMFTALVVWLMLKWEEQADSPHAVRWILLVAYLMGLSIGVHLLNLLTIPALVFIYYFRKTPRATLKGCVIATLVSGAILFVVNGLIIPYTVYFGAMTDLFFVNILHLPVNSGMVFYVFALFALCGFGVWFTHKKGYVLANLIIMSVTLMLLGFSTYASMTIRAAVNPPMNSNNPDNPHALLAVLNRDQYGNKPLLYGSYYSARKAINGMQYDDLYWYNSDSGRYEKGTRLTGYTVPSELMHFFPRMWDMHKSERDYKTWAAYRTKTEVLRDDNGEVIRDADGRPVRGKVTDYGKRVRFGYGDGTYDTVVEPTFLENLNYFFNYQLSYMYLRYFLWNFVGRQDDIQPLGTTITNGNWLSGIKVIDEAYLGPQSNLPREMADNRARNTYYFLPFILGLIGLIYQLNRDQRNFAVVLWMFIMMGVALVVYFNSSPAEVRERDYVYAGSFYAYCIWIGFGVLAVKELLTLAMRKHQSAAAAIATVLCLSVPAVLCAENWDDHDRSGRTMAHDVGWNYLQSALPNSIIINYGDNDTFPLWLNQEVDGVRPDIRIMNSSYLGGEWYIDQMKTAANDAAGVPLSFDREKYWYVNESYPVYDRVDRTVDIQEVIDFVKSEDPRSKLTMGDGSLNDFVPAKRIALPVNKDNAVAAGIVRKDERHLMVDTVYIDIRKNSLERSDMMILDMLANFDWKRPIAFTQVYVLQDLGLLDYLQFDGYTYRLVPILTPYKSSWEIGRIDPDYVVPLLENTFRYGNLADPKVYVDYFTQYNLAVGRTRETFARVAKELIRRGDDAKALELLDRGLEVLPINQIRFSDANTYPFLEAYYALGEFEKGDALFYAYADTLIEYIEYYLQFDGALGDMVSDIIDEKLDSLWQLYYLAGYAGRDEIILYLNDYYRTLGATDEDLINVSEVSE
ncbi:MAG: DUF2723 domain-containing protein [Alistipes sp.]|nr:DUF2723 domain-containing protein [Alistipes sp.]